jgi:hypothetical protein
MRVLVFADKSGNIQSVTLPNPQLPGIHVEMEGASAQELEVDERAIRTDELMGRKGLDAQKKGLRDASRPHGQVHRPQVTRVCRAAFEHDALPAGATTAGEL